MGVYCIHAVLIYSALIQAAVWKCPWAWARERESERESCIMWPAAAAVFPEGTTTPSSLFYSKKPQHLNYHWLCTLFFFIQNGKHNKLQQILNRFLCIQRQFYSYIFAEFIKSSKIQASLFYMLRTFPRLWTLRQIFPHSCSLAFRKWPTCSEWTTSQNTQISACSLWMLALHVGNCEDWIKRLTDRHTCRDHEPRRAT